MSLYCRKLITSLLFAGTMFLSLKVTTSQIAPYFTEEPSDSIAKKNRQAVLRCQAGGQPSPNISWKRNDVVLDLSGDTRRRILPDGSLLFRTIEHSKSNKPDEGLYQCVAMSQINALNYELVSRTARLQVAGLSSKLSVEPRRVQVIFGDVARFYCKVRHSVPAPTIQWKFKQKDGSIVALHESNKVTLLPGGILQIRNTQFTDGGEYMCTARNPVTNKEHSSGAGVLRVIPDNGYKRRPDFVTQPPSSINATRGTQVVLECAVKGSPKPTVKWYKNDQLVMLGSKIEIVGESNLKINQVSSADAGTYKCEATEGRRTASHQVRLGVHYPPVLTRKLQNRNAYVASDVTFYCSANGSPTPVVYWTKNSIKIYNTDFTIVGDGFLRVEDLLPSDMGVYQCFATNSLGNIQTSAELSVYKRGVPLPTTPALTTTPLTTTPVPTTTPAPTTIPATTTEAPRTPDLPENVRTKTLSDTEIEVSWSPPKKTFGKILSYHIFYTLTKGGLGIINMTNVSGDTLRVKISNLQHNTEYNFLVYARNKYGTGAISQSVMGRTASNVPGPPQDLVAVALSSSEIKVQWGAPVSGKEPVTRYIVEYQETSGKTPKLTVVTKNQQKTLRYLKTNTEYKISVYGFTEKGLRGSVATITAFTHGGIPKGKPRNLVVNAAVGGKALIVTWDPPHHSLTNGQITKYALEYRKVGESKSKRVEMGGVLKHTITKLQPSTLYEVQVAAGAASGFGDFTDWVKASTNISKCTESVPPGKPQGLQVTLPLKGERMIQVKWQPPVDAGQVCVTGYVIQYGAGNPYKNKKERKANVTSILLGRLTAGKQYVIKVMAKNQLDNGPSAEESIFIPISGAIEKPVRQVHVEPISSSALRVTWTESKDRGSQLYHVYHALKKTVVYCGNTTMNVKNCTGLKPYTYYTILVRRNGERVNGTATNQTLQAKASPPTDITLSALDGNTTDLNANWQIPEKVNGKILRYRIYYSTSPDAAEEAWHVKTCNGTTMQTRLKGLTPGTKYYFKMQVENGAGWSDMSKIKMVITPNGTAGTDSTEMTPSVIAQVGGPGGLENKTLWIIIAAVAGITLIAIIIISVVLCKKRSVDDIQAPRKPPPTYKSAIQSNGSAKKKNKDEKPPDLWINHTDKMEMKPLTTQNPPPDVTSNAPSTFEPMKPIHDDPLDQRNFETAPLRRGSDSELDPLPPPPAHMLRNDDDAIGDGLPSPVSSPGPAPYHPVVTYPRSGTPDLGAPSYPMTSTPRYDKQVPRSGSFDDSAEPINSAPPQRSHSYDLDYPPSTKPVPKTMVPVFPMPNASDGPHYKVPQPVKTKQSAPRDDIQLPPVGYNRGPGMLRANKTPNGLRSPPPSYNELYHAKQAAKETGDVVADLDKEIAGLEGLMRDLNEITANDRVV